MPILPLINDLMQAALQYATQGFEVFPITPGAKEPLLAESWPLIATTEPTQLVEWWTQFPTANIGIKAGERWVIVDVDRKKGKDGWAEVGHLIDQNTPWVQTPNQGWHFYYSSPSLGENEHLRSLPGVDIQHGNRYVLAPPSVLELSPWDDPVAYVWGNRPRGKLYQDSVAPLPPALLDHLMRPLVESAAADMPILLDGPFSWPTEQIKRIHVDFLSRGVVSGVPSRSEMLLSLATRLYKLGFEDSPILSMLWANAYVQQTCMEHRQGDESRALNYLWSSISKVRHHRVKPVEEVFSAQQQSPIEGELVDSPHGELFRGLRDQASRLLDLGDPRPILQGMAAAGLDPIERDTILAVLKSRGHVKSTLTATLRVYEREVSEAAQSESGNRVQWAHVTGDQEKPLGTLENLQAMLTYYRVIPKHNLMNHSIDVDLPGERMLEEERLNTQLTRIRSWSAQLQMPLDTVAEQLNMLATRNAYHPFKEYCERLAWDGNTRLPELLATIKMEKGKEHLKSFLVTRWLLSIVAVVYGINNRPPRGVLTFIGSQLKGKTTWVYYLVPKGMYLQGHLLDPSNRDSATKGLKYLICELGEVGSTYKRSSIEKLKSYIGQREDVHRMPYAHAESSWPRRTIFAASTNNEEILHDTTGNTRWWVLPVEGFDLNFMEAWWGVEGQGHELQQLWAELLVLYNQGYSWDLSDEEAATLGMEQEDHRERSYIETELLNAYQWEEVPPPRGYPRPLTDVDIWADIGMKPRPGTQDRADLHEALRILTGQRRPVLKKLHLVSVEGKVSKEAKNVVGRCWYLPEKVPLRQGGAAPFRAIDDKDRGE